MIKIAQTESIGTVYTHTDSSLVNNIVENTTFICHVVNKSMCNVKNYGNIICKQLE